MKLLKVIINFSTSFNIFLGGITLLAFLLLSGCSQINFNPDNTITDTRILKEFKQIKFDGTGNIHLTKGESESITIVARQGYVEKIKTRIDDDTLVISITPNIFTSASDPRENVNLYISFHTLEALFLDGSYSLNGQGLADEVIKIEIRGVGPVDLEDIQCERLEIHLSGGGVVTVTGTAVEQQLTISGAHIYNAADLKSRMITANLSGQSNTILWAEETLNLAISENASVGYYGNLETMSGLAEHGNVIFLGLK